MGFTHYYRKGSGTAEPAHIEKADEIILKILQDHDTSLAGPHGKKGTKPEIDERSIAFNGIEEESHETFFIPRNPKYLHDFNFCKTARKDYDPIVTAVLTILALYWGPAIEISSDGDPDDWSDGFDIAEKYINQNDADLLAIKNAASSWITEAFAARVLGD